MSKPLLGLLLGAILGIFDGLTALISAPEPAARDHRDRRSARRSRDWSSACSSAGSRRRSIRSPLGIAVGLVAGAAFAALIGAFPASDGRYYFWEIVLPGYGPRHHRRLRDAALRPRAAAGAGTLIQRLVTVPAWPGGPPWRLQCATTEVRCFDFVSLSRRSSCSRERCARGGPGAGRAGQRSRADRQRRRGDAAGARRTRRDIHRHPELGFRETRTAALVADRLRALKFDEVRTGVGVTGVVGVLKGGRPGGWSRCAPTWTRCRSPS